MNTVEVLARTEEALRRGIVNLTPEQTTEVIFELRDALLNREREVREEIADEAVDLARMYRRMRPSDAHSFAASTLDAFSALTRGKSEHWYGPRSFFCGSGQ